MKDKYEELHATITAHEATVHAMDNELTACQAIANEMDLTHTIDSLEKAMLYLSQARGWIADAAQYVPETPSPSTPFP